MTMRRTIHSTVVAIFLLAPLLGFGQGLSLGELIGCTQKSVSSTLAYTNELLLRKNWEYNSSKAMEHFDVQTWKNGEQDLGLMIPTESPNFELNRILYRFNNLATYNSMLKFVARNHMKRTKTTNKHGMINVHYQGVNTCIILSNSSKSPKYSVWVYSTLDYLHWSYNEDLLDGILGNTHY